MSISYVSAELRRLVLERAEGLCEYCLIAEEDSGYGCEVDHVISKKHGGRTVENNLALACTICNQAKGSDIASLVWPSGELHRLFNPRLDAWRDHFLLVGPRLEKLTPIGQATVQLLRFNTLNRLEERELLIVKGRYPSLAAKRLM